MNGQTFFAVADVDGNIVRSGITLDGDVASQAGVGEVVIIISRRIASDQDMWRINLSGVLERRDTRRVEGEA